MRALLLLILVFAVTPAWAAADLEVAPVTSASHRLRYDYANDAFAGTDYYYTQGMGLRWTSPLLLESPLALPLPELWLDEGAREEVSLEWRYEGFTPDDYFRRAIQVGDRPFSAYMLLRHRRTRIAEDGWGSVSVAWGLGYLGPRVGGQQFQAEIHRFVGSREPRGWRNQLDDDLLVQLEVEVRQRLLGWRHLDLDAEGRLQGGTLFCDLTLGLRLRCGLLGPPLGSPGEETRFYVWGAFSGRAVAFNALLEGGVLGDSVYELSSRDVERGVAVGRCGATFERGALGLSFSFTVTSAEFRGGRSHAWGAWGVTVFFG